MEKKTAQKRMTSMDAMDLMTDYVDMGVPLMSARGLARSKGFTDRQCDNAVKQILENGLCPKKLAFSAINHISSIKKTKAVKRIKEDITK